jgi:hypothetical protein
LALPNEVMDELFVRIDDLETGISDTPAITLQSCAVQIRLALSEHERQGALGDLGLAALRQAVASLDTLAAKQPDDDTVSKLSNARSKSSRSAARSWAETDGIKAYRAARTAAAPTRAGAA